jgi:hypothetical protein
MQTNVEDRIAEAVISAKNGVSLITVSGTEDFSDTVVTSV